MGAHTGVAFRIVCDKTIDISFEGSVTLCYTFSKREYVQE
jgi:hypothetical protein